MWAELRRVEGVVVLSDSFLAQFVDKSSLIWFNALSRDYKNIVNFHIIIILISYM